MILAPYFNKRCYVPESHYLIDPHPYRLKHVQTAMDAYRYGDGGCSGGGGGGGVGKLPPREIKRSSVSERWWV